MRRASGFLFSFLVFSLLSFPVLADPLVAYGLTFDSMDTVIDFGNTPVKDIEPLIHLVEQMPLLREVDMYQQRLPREDMERLFDMFPDIFWGFTLRFSEHTVRTDVSAFSTLHGSCPNPPHSEKEFSMLRMCRNLEALDIGHNATRDISWLAGLTHLKVLIIAINQIEDISVLSQLHELQYLEVFTNKVTDVTPLLGLTNLVDLNLSNNPISDLRPLYKMTWLRRLWLGDFMQYPEEQKAEIMAALPDTEFFWGWGPTAGTWREHPHYFALYDFFRTRVFVPFDDLN